MVWGLLHIKGRKERKGGRREGKGEREKGEKRGVSKGEGREGKGREGKGREGKGRRGEEGNQVEAFHLLGGQLWIYIKTFHLGFRLVCVLFWFN